MKTEKSMGRLALAASALIGAVGASALPRQRPTNVLAFSPLNQSNTSLYERASILRY